MIQNNEYSRTYFHECNTYREVMMLLSKDHRVPEGAHVSDIEPKYGSLAGFSADQFSQNDDPNVGNKVYLVGESGSEFSCTVHKDGCTESQVMCYTPRGMPEEDHYVKVKVDGEVVEDGSLCNGDPTSSECTFKPDSGYTPTIEALTPQSGKPGSFITMFGNLITDRYGSNLPAAKNGKTVKLLRVYAGPQDCGLKENDEFYGLALDDDESDHGTLKCKTKGTSVGFFNASFIVESPYGRSNPDPELYRVSYNDKIHMFQTYTDISSISHAEGSLEGGLVLTVYGNYFDNREPYTQPRIYIGDTECQIKEVVVDQYVSCEVAADPSSGGSSFPGNRGVNYEYWTSTSKDMSSLDSILSLTSSSSGYNHEILDETYFNDVSDTMDNYASKMTTYFTPPHTGEYEFHLLADDGARLFIDGAEAVTSERDWETSDRINLDSNNRYLLEVVHYENYGDSFVDLKAKYFNTEFTSAYTGNAKQEVQVISISSTVKYDKQKIEFKKFSSQTAVGEVQTVKVDTPGEFRFGLFGVFTEPLTTNMADTAIKDAINSLPVFGSEESVSVTRQAAATPTFQISFDSKRGDFPDISVVKVVNSSSVAFKVSSDTDGTPDLDTVALSLADVVSDPFSVASLDASKLEAAIEVMFEAKCPDVFSPRTAKYYQSFEEYSSEFTGTIVKDTEPFCGRYSLKDPFRIYKKKEKDFGIMLSSYGVMCFAYKGFLRNYIGMKFSYKSSTNFETEERWHWFTHNFKTDSDTESETWYYTCVNVYDEAKALQPTDTEHRLEEVRVFSLNEDQSGYVDSVVIGQKITTEDPEINVRRRRPARPNNAIINDVTVSSASSTEYTVTLKPFECGNEFPLFELANGRVTSGKLSYPSSSVTSTLYNGNGAISVTRTSEASPPVTGMLDVMFNGKTKTGLNISLEEKDFSKELASLNGIGSLSVTKEGDCANFDLSVTFLTLPGDQGEMKVKNAQLDGINPAASISTSVDGGLFYTPLTGDMATTVHGTPQVRLYINDVPTACSGDCSFQWKSSVTPTVTSVSPSTGTSALSTSISISGTGFSTDITKNAVSIGDVACSVTASTATSITCDVGNGPVGQHKVMVNVDGKGFAKHSSGDVMFEYTANIDSISPTSGSLGGGVTLTISGYGFKDGASVTINSASCDVRSVQPDQIECVVPAMKSDGTHDVEIEQGSTTLTYSGYTYDSSLTATISSVTPTTLGVLGGRLTISGSSFTSTSGRVHVGSVAGTIASWTDSQIEVDVSGVPAGTHELKVETSNGLATDGNGDIPSVDVDLGITNVFPLTGSILGGTKLTVTGTGFGTNATLVDVNVGDVECEIDTVTDTQIVCDITNAATTHSVTNKGTSQEFGVFYAYDESYIKINAGDSISWSWETPDFVNDVTHAIIEVESPSATKAKIGGFSSGTPSKNGQYTKQFTETGIFYVWSGYVDPWSIKHYSGTVEVTAAQSRLEEISVKVGGIEALHNVGGAADPSDSSGCKSVTTGIDTCSDSQPTGGDSSKFNFAFWTCSTPTVSSIDVNNGTVQTTVTLSGEGFSNTDCQNEISFGAYSCDVTSSSDTMVTCNFAKSEEPDLGVLYPVAVRVGNRGNALVEITSDEDKGFGLIPNIETITPTSGSLAGGARVTITGFGFGDSPMVYIGTSTCEIIDNSYTEIICESPASSQGERDIEVHAYVNGNPLTAECETSTRTCRFSYATLWTPSVTTIDPDSMSGTTTVTITGTSFGTTNSELEVTIGGALATVTSAADTSLTASIDNIPAGDNDVIVRVKDYGKASGSLKMYGTPTITTVTPSSGSVNGETVITIQGNGFVENDTAVTIDGTSCDIISTTLSEVICETRPHAAASVSVSITSNGVSYTPSSYSFSTGSTPTITSVSPSSGFSGDTLTISGSSFGGGAVSVTLNDADCTVTSSSSTQIQCTLGSHSTGSVPVSVYVEGLGRSNTDQQFEYQLSLNSISPTVAQTCDVAITLNGLTKTLAGSYTYDAALTPTVSDVTPTRGGTGGGTTLTITGSGFGSVVGDVNVMIDDVECVVSTATETEVVCVTGPHLGSVDTKVEVQVSGNGIANEVSAGDADFSYIDVWSSLYTWGGVSLPQEGEFIIIPSGMTLLLDTDTAILSFLLIQGGKLIFDEKDVELQAKIIMVTDGGLLQVGTESQPFQHKGIITLHGHHRDKEMPIYGTKVLAVRNGTLDLHGKRKVPLTWTRLSSTASAGSSTLELQDPVEWNVGDEITIACTGHKHSQSENEKKTISSISSDKRTLTLDSALEATHWGTQETFDGTNVEFRAEIGLLTHNVVVRGNSDAQWEDKIEACEAGFDTGEFATQTCFLGRFGDEIGSSQFGAMILVHAPVYDTHEAQARISYTEVTFAGQAFRLGRYPIHFHLNGDMSTSYVRGCGIHHTFNRAVNIHGTHNTLVEKTVIYNIMGGAFFLEDGIETGNTIQYNLAVFVRESSSLLNDDVTPASYWVTNPNNTIQHNAAAGGTHFGYWYRMHDHPEGPSYTETVCPIAMPLGVFSNNSAHSFGWFGLWIFPDYFPKKDACGGTEVEPAVFDGLYAWNNDKGAEAVNSGALQFKNFVLVQNKLAGYEGKLVIDAPLYTDDAPMIADSLIVGTTTVIPGSEQGCTKGGIIFPYGAGFRAVNIRFVDFADSECAAFRFTRIDGTCGDLCGGYTYHAEGLKFVNSPNKAVYAWEWEGIIVDKDGSATGKAANWAILPTTGTLPTDCESAPDYSLGIAASMCPPPYHKWHRFSFNKASPQSLEGRNFMITNQYGTSSCPFAEKRISHGLGWALALLDGSTYTFEFEGAAQINNISFSGRFEHFEASEYVFMEMVVETLPDRFSFDGGETYINATVGGIDPSTAENGDWEWDNTNSKVKFIVHGNKRSRRSSPGMTAHSVDRPVSFTAYKCYYENCIPPPDPDTVPPATERPLDFDIWDDTTLWNNSNNDSFVSNTGGSYGLPQDYDDVRIAFGSWVVVNKTTPFSKLGTLFLEGVLEFFDTPGAVYEIEADFIIIKGGRLIIGWPDDAFDGLATITLRGNHSSPYYYPGDGPILGSKAIGVFGGLDLFGKDVGRTWTELATTATAGSNKIVLTDQVQWSQGDEIVVGPTGFDPWQTESFKIEAVASDNVTLTLNSTLKYLHTAHRETLSNGQEIKVGAAVGMLSRNIKIVGQDYDDLYKESFGARVLVGLVTSEGQAYTGYARLSNVEFYHTGQEGFTDEYDPRYSLAYLATGSVSHVKPSFVSKCSFHNGFSTAIGAFGIASLNITDNVIFGAIGHGLRTSSEDTHLINNLLALVVSTVTYQDRFEVYDYESESGIEAISATDLTLQDNLVTGAERIAFHVPPQDCDDTSDKYKNNKAYANVLGGVVITYHDVLKQTDCAKMAGHTVWKTHDYGIYYQNELNLLVENNLLIENTNGLFPIIIKPPSLSHLYANKTMQVRSTTFVGETSSFDCSNDVANYQDPNYQLSTNARPSFPPSGGKVGLIFPGFYTADNGLPSHPWKGIMSYPALGGLMILNNITFAKYRSTSCKSNFAVSTNVANDDLMHPVISKGSTLIEVDESNKIVYHRPNVGKINSADCVDMDCDGLKKALFKDLDGTFLGHVGSVIPQSEYEWDGDPRRGLGDHRIPETLLTDANGNRIPVDSIAPNKGIIRNRNCSYHSSWQAYECNDDLNYELLIIESMDEDTETRRLSPVALLGDGYIDLINGPQDQGWCSGYTCRLRVSTFFALVATDKEYLVHLSSVTPKHIRYRLLNANPDEGIKLTLWYSRSNRLDVYVDDDFVLATNAKIDSNGRYITTAPNGNEFEPQIANGTGTNFFDKDSGELTLIIQGSQRIDVKTLESVIVTFGIPALTVDQFFGDGIVENLANFLNIPLTKVRVVNVVSASSSGRRKRSGDGITVEVEIGDEPMTSINDTAPDSIDYSALTEIAANIVNECQVGNVSETLNVTGGCETVEVPSSDPDVASIVYNTPTPDHLYFAKEPVPEYEGVQLKKQPKIRAADISSNVVTDLGTAEFPWQLTVSLRAGTGHPNAILNGTLTVNCSDGWFIFTDLEISHMGTGYILDFNVSYPAEAENFTLASDPFDVDGRPLKIHVYDKTSGDIVRDARFSVTLDLQDSNTEEIISDIAWRDHTWTAEVSLLGSSPYASLDGVLTSSFDTATGQAMFPDLTLTGIGMYYLQFNVVSNPPDFKLTLNEKMGIKHPSHVGMTIEEEYEVQVKFDVDFNKVLPTGDKQNEFEQMVLTEYANLWPDVQLTVGSIREGSIVVTFVISGTYTDVNSTAYSLCDSIYNQTSYSYNGYSLTLSPYLTINNQTYYGVTCGDLSEEDEDEGLAVYLIVIIVLLCLLVTIAVVVVVIWKCTVKPKTQTHDWRTGTLYNGDKPVEDQLFREDSGAPLKFNIGQAPVMTTFASEKRQPSSMSGFSLRMNSPDPISVSRQSTQYSSSGMVHPPPTYNSSNISHVVKNMHRPRNQSASSLNGRQDSRPHSAVSDRDSPLPPVGQSIHNLELI
ncbi:fibrocystin-L-like [Mercenaria mercenaria]|uniref:fibrocystin-L-like n=1 Tax=Mercenaria mercenaria TaxID=6596 RepID=UPI00234F422F|nr:fibrocystin-L-like [Mercenaria mercenaria]